MSASLKKIHGAKTCSKLVYFYKRTHTGDVIPPHMLFFPEGCLHLPPFQWIFFFLFLIINILVIGLNKPEWSKLLLLDIEAWLEVSLIIVLYTVTMETCLSLLNLVWLVYEFLDFTETCLGADRAEGLSGAKAEGMLNLQIQVSEGPGQASGGPLKWELPILSSPPLPSGNRDVCCDRQTEKAKLKIWALGTISRWVPCGRKGSGMGLEVDEFCRRGRSGLRGRRKGGKPWAGKWK